MSKFVLEINTGNAAFGENDPDMRSVEIARILRDLASRVEGNSWTLFKVLDLNGNTVGEAELKE